MKLINSIYLAIIFLLFTTQSTNLFAQDYDRDSFEEANDKSLSPYFFIQSEKGDVDNLPLKSTSSEVNISGNIADVTVSQVYKNQGQSPLEAKYIFPASSHAAVYGMKMTIGERIIVAKIKEKQEAKRTYDQAKKEGKSASLLEEHRPNVFQMKVANIMPGDEIKVELKYTEIIIPTDNVYEFVYPTVVGPRYSNRSAKSAPADEHWVENPYLHAGEAPTYGFDMHLHVSAGMPIKELLSDTHKINVNFLSDSLADIKLDESEKYAGNKDFILRYRLAGDEIDSGALLYEGEDENYFLLTVQPPKRVAPSIIPPREYLFIIDVSGSMDGFPLDTSKKLLRDLISNLKPSDKFNVLLFAGDSSIMSDKSLPANEANIVRAISMIEGQRGMGGTEIVPALKRGLALPQDDTYSRSIVIVTDGYVSVEREAFDLISKNLSRANVFSFGIGSSVNRFLIDGLARAGRGEPFIVTRPVTAPEIANKFREYINSPVLTSIGINYEGFDAYDNQPDIVPDLFAQRPLTVIGKWKGKLQGSIRVHGTTGLGNFEKIIDLSRLKADSAHSALKYLWARTKVAELADYNKIYSDPDKVKQITNLGLKYNLLTEFTSFVAVDHVVRNETGKLTSVKQPLPLPENVSDLAVGGSIPSAPEPETYLLLLISILALVSYKLKNGYVQKELF